jgi:hypothetical protein
MCWSFTCRSQTFERTGDKVIRKGVAIEFSTFKAGDFTMPNESNSGPVVHRAATIARPVKVNGVKVPAKGPWPVYEGEFTFHDYLFASLGAELANLPDGNYTLNLRDILVGSSGKVVYFGYEGVRDSSGGNPLALDLQLEIFNKLCAVIDEAKFSGKTPSFIDDRDIWKAPFRASNGNIYIGKNDPGKKN